MAKTGMVHARMDATLKENVENILSQMGLTSSEAIGLFYRQIELYNGLPFELKLPQIINRPIEKQSTARTAYKADTFVNVATAPLEKDFDIIEPKPVIRERPKVDVDSFKRELKEMGLTLGSKDKE